MIKILTYRSRLSQGLGHQKHQGFKVDKATRDRTEFGRKFSRLFRAMANASSIVIALPATYIHASIKGYILYKLYQRRQI